MHFNGQMFSSVFEQFPYNSKFFGVRTAKIDFLKRKMVLRVVSIKLTFKWLQTGLSDLKKHQTIEILLMVDFMHFKMVHFSKFFEIFEIHHYFW